MLELRHKSSLKHKQRTWVTPRPTRIRKRSCWPAKFIHLFRCRTKTINRTAWLYKLQAIVGRSDLLEQVRSENLLNLRNLLQIIEHPSVTTTEGVPEKQFKTVHSADSKELVGVGVEQRVMGGLESCYRVRSKLYEATQRTTYKVYGWFYSGNGLGAYNSENLFIHVNGGDGIGKTSFGGGIYITKSKGKDGVYYNGSVGKGFGYGAQRALYVQGNADARAGIRLSGAT